MVSKWSLVLGALALLVMACGARTNAPDPQSPIPAMEQEEAWIVEALKELDTAQSAFLSALAGGNSLLAGKCFEQRSAMLRRMATRLRQGPGIAVPRTGRVAQLPELDEPPVSSRPADQGFRSSLVLEQVPSGAAPPNYRILLGAPDVRLRKGARDEGPVPMQIVLDARCSLIDQALLLLEGDGTWGVGWRSAERLTASERLDLVIGSAIGTKVVARDVAVARWRHKGNGGIELEFELLDPSVEHRFDSRLETPFVSFPVLLCDCGDDGGDSVSSLLDSMWSERQTSGARDVLRRGYADHLVHLTTRLRMTTGALVNATKDSADRWQKLSETIDSARKFVDSDRGGVEHRRELWDWYKIESVVSHATASPAGVSLLDVAAFDGSLDQVKDLMALFYIDPEREGRAELRALCEKGPIRPLDAALLRGHHQVVDVLVSSYSHPLEVDPDGTGLAPVHLAALVGDEKSLLRLFPAAILEAAQQRRDAMKPNGTSPYAEAMEPRFDAWAPRWMNVKSYDSEDDRIAQKGPLVLGTLRWDVASEGGRLTAVDYANIGGHEKLARALEDMGMRGRMHQEDLGFEPLREAVSTLRSVLSSARRGQ
jgi:hypothetical protein